MADASPAAPVVTQAPEGALQRELWRLGALLTGHATGADQSLHRVLSTQPDVLKLSLERARRLAVLGARDWAASASADQAVRASVSWPAALPRLGSIEPLQREAWVLARVLDLGEAEIGRVMGVTREAARRYADEARARLEAPGAALPARAELLAWADSVGVDAGLARVDSRLERVRRRRALVATAQVALLAMAMLVVVWLGRSLMRQESAERERLKSTDTISLPMPVDDAKRMELERNRRQQATAPAAPPPAAPAASPAPAPAPTESPRP